MEYSWTLAILQSFVNWLLTNMPALGILVVIGWGIWKYISWIDGRFRGIVDFVNSALKESELRWKAFEIEMRERQKEHENSTKTFMKEMEIRFEKMEERMREHDKEMDDRFQKLIDRIDARLDKFESKINSRVDKLEDRIDSNQSNQRKTA